ncbi:hypothetical protein J6590_023054 [Homalodisca vitripennis]|nr:hypothetical protein J6590_023054 [Homalodisca vitripennis]
MIAIAIKGLTKKFNNHTVLNNVNLTVRLGEVLAIIGPSGSGKTTLLRSINLLETPDYGSIQVGNIIIDTSIPLYHQKKQICYLRQQVGFVFQHFHLFPHRSVLDNIIEGLIVVKKEPREEAVAKARKLLDQVGLRDKENFFPKNLSGGQQQRVAIARALAMRPEVILFDEPTSALDPELVGDVLSTIRNLANEQRTMVIVTHEISFARDVADQAIFMADGHIVEQSSADDLFTHPVHERWTDIDLSDQGRIEAKNAGQLLKQAGFIFDFAYTSVLKRAIHTLWYILDELDQAWLPVEKSWRLNERHYGALQGLNKKKITVEYGEEQVQQWRRSLNITPPELSDNDKRLPIYDIRYAKLSLDQLPKAESLAMTINRIIPYWKGEILPRINNGERVIIAAHAQDQQNYQLKYYNKHNRNSVIGMD